MKNLFLTILAIFTISLTSCKSDDDGGSSNTIVGTWTETITYGDDVDVDTYTFNSDNTYINVYTETLDDETETETFTGTYKLDGNNIAISNKSITLNFKYAISDNKLTLIRDGETATYTKK